MAETRSQMLEAAADVPTDPVEIAATGLAEAVPGVEYTPIEGYRDREYGYQSRASRGRLNDWENYQAREWEQTRSDANIDSAKRRLQYNEEGKVGFLRGLGTEDQFNPVSDLYRNYERYVVNPSQQATVFGKDPTTGGNLYAAEHDQFAPAPRIDARDEYAREAQDAYGSYEAQQAQLKAKYGLKQNKTVKDFSAFSEEDKAAWDEMERLKQELRYGPPDKDTPEWSKWTQEEMDAADRSDPRYAQEAFNTWVSEELDPLQDEIAAAFEAGDEERAQELIDQREAMKTDSGFFSDVSGARLWEAVTDSPVKDPGLLAREALSNPTAQQLGRRTQLADALQDPTSAEYQERMGQLVDPALTRLDADRIRANRTIGRAMDQAKQQVNRGRLAGGAASNPIEMSALLSRVDEMGAAERANVELEAMTQASTIVKESARFLTQYADAFEANQIQMNLDYIGQAPGMRDHFVDAQIALELAASNIARANFSDELSSWTQLEAIERQLSAQGGTSTFDWVDFGVSTLIGGAAVGVAALGGDDQAGVGDVGVGDVYTGGLTARGAAGLGIF